MNSKYLKIVSILEGIKDDVYISPSGIVGQSVAGVAGPIPGYLASSILGSDATKNLARKTKEVGIQSLKSGGRIVKNITRKGIYNLKNPVHNQKSLIGNGKW